MLLQLSYALPDVHTSFQINTSSPSRSFSQPWKFAVGSGHAKLALRTDWRIALNKTTSELGIRAVRFHGLFDDDMGPVVRPDGTYNFDTISSIFDYILDIGMTPLVELSFQPTALASGKRTYLQYKANVTPPKNMTKWSELIRAFGTFVLTRYGKEEISKWSFEVWNEPDLHLLGPIKSFWTGTMQDYYQLYISTSNALKSISHVFRIGGPVTSNTTGFLKEFVAAVSSTSSVDFLSSHEYPATGVDRNAFSTLLFEATSIASDMQRPYVLSEYNDGLSTFCCHDTEYAAVFMLREAAAVQSGGCTLSSEEYCMDASNKIVPSGMSFWTFSDIFEEEHSVAQNKLKAPFHNAFGMMTLQGIKKPIWRALAVLNALNISSTLDGIIVKNTTFGSSSSVTQTNVAEIYATTPTPVVVSVTEGEGAHNTNMQMQMDIVVINFTPAPSHDAIAQNISIHVVTTCSLSSSLPLPLVTVAKIDADHSNSFRTWENQLNKQKHLNQSQVQKLNLATQVVFTVWSQVSVEDTNTIVISGLVLSPTCISAAVLRVKWSCK